MKQPKPLSMVLAGAAALALLSGCASTRVDAQWRDSQQPSRSYRGEKVLVVCEAYDTVIRRLCQDQMVAEVSARGAKPVVVAEGPMPNPWRPTPPDQLVPIARSAGASAVLSAALEPGNATVKPGFSVGFGLGGFGGGGFGGVGVSAPIGGGQAMSGFSADTQFTDAGSSKLLWTARVSSDASTNVNEQMNELAKAIVDAAQKAGLL
jgi:hypothetical protein